MIARYAVTYEVPFFGHTGTPVPHTALVIASSPARAANQAKIFSGYNVDTIQIVDVTALDTPQPTRPAIRFPIPVALAAS